MSTSAIVFLIYIAFCIWLVLTRHSILGTVLTTLCLVLGGAVIVLYPYMVASAAITILKVIGVLIFLWLIFL